MHPLTGINLTHRRSKRNRFSISKLSSETVQTLPEYSSSPNWSTTCAPFPPIDAESDRPPDYSVPQDEEDASIEPGRVYSQHHLVNTHPRRPPSHVRRRKRAPAAAEDPFLDTLLERSVHALEMSNALLRTTMSTQSSLSAVLSSDNESDHFLEVRARNLSTRIRVSSGVHDTWMEHLEELSEGVDKLSAEQARNYPGEEFVSQSLPSASMPDRRHRRKPSILELHRSSNSHLRYSHPTRDALIAAAPKALTQCVESTADPLSITLPSTLGLRASSSVHPFRSGEPPNTYCRETHLPPSEGTLPEGVTPACHLLSNLVKRSGSLTPPSSARIFRFRDRCASASPVGIVRGRIPSFSLSSVQTSHPPPDPSQSRSEAQASRPCPETRASSAPSLTIPADDDLSSSESSDRPTGYRTVQSLRKILGDHPSSSSVDTLQRKLHSAPTFLPISPPPPPTQGTSTATASISQLYTKGRHSLSTRPPSPPPHSSLKVRSVPPTPSPSPSTMSLSEVFGNGVARVIGTAPSSSVSMPKRISFAELPESRSGLQPGTSKLRVRKQRKKRRQGKDSDKEESGGWLKALLRGGLLSDGLATMGSREEMMEGRMARGWGGRPGYGTLDDWAT